MIAYVDLIEMFVIQYLTVFHIFKEKTLKFVSFPKLRYFQNLNFKSSLYVWHGFFLRKINILTLVEILEQEFYVNFYKSNAIYLVIGGKFRY